MAYLRTVVTYHQPSEAEVDKSFLEAHGITVCLLNANTARNELGPAFYIQLQVPDEQYAQSVTLLREANPERFGSAERVAEIERGIFRVAGWFMVPAAVFGIGGFVLTPAPHGFEMDLRGPVAIACGGLAGIVSVAVMRWLRKPTPDPTARD